MKTHAELEKELLTAYDEIFKEHKDEVAKWAVHKISPDKIDEPVSPTIPFVGKEYADQKTKILVYASAETLNDYCVGEPTNRFWLDVDSEASNRHRKCFNESVESFFPNVHITPMNKGYLATAIMYLSHLIRHSEPQEPKVFYETIAFGNYSKFSIETKYQEQLRKNLHLTDGEKKILYKQLGNKNIDTADKNCYLTVSRDYILQDIAILEPDYIIMPRINDTAFITELRKRTKIIEIYQMNSQVVNQMGEGGRNNPNNIYKSRDIEQLPDIIQRACQEIKGINHEKYRYVFDYLDKVLESELTNNK